MFLLSPVAKNIKRSIVGIGVGFVAIVGLVLIVGGNSILSERQMSRITSVIESSGPCDEENYYTTGNQVCNGYIAINNGGFLGVGPGNSTQKFSFIPEPHTDSVFAIFAEEYGVLWSTFLFLAYIIIIKRIINISSNATTIRGRYIALGIATYITFHIVVNLGGIFGLIPLTGIPLPFLSYGGTYAITLIIAIAIVERIHIETKNAQIKL